MRNVLEDLKKIWFEKCISTSLSSNDVYVQVGLMSLVGSSQWTFTLLVQLPLHYPSLYMKSPRSTRRAPRRYSNKVNAGSSSARSRTKESIIYIHTSPKIPKTERHHFYQTSHIYNPFPLSLTLTSSPSTPHPTYSHRATSWAHSDPSHTQPDNAPPS
jgi:hypothetical protein